MLLEPGGVGIGLEAVLRDDHERVAEGIGQRRPVDVRGRQTIEKPVLQFLHFLIMTGIDPYIAIRLSLFTHP